MHDGIQLIKINTGLPSARIGYLISYDEIVSSSFVFISNQIIGISMRSFFFSSEDFQQQIIAHKLYQYFKLIRNRTKWTEYKEKNAMTSIRFRKSDTF